MGREHLGDGRSFAPRFQTCVHVARQLVEVYLLLAHLLVQLGERYRPRLLDHCVFDGRGGRGGGAAQFQT